VFRNLLRAAKYLHSTTFAAQKLRFLAVWGNAREASKDARPNAKILGKVPQIARFWSVTAAQMWIKWTLKQMAHFRALCVEVLLVVGVGRRIDGNAFHDLQAVSFQSDDFFGIIGQETHLADSKVD
jgi:hypothetical protein